ncbi:hypothetical protein [Halomonas sp. I5-271120]|uniref:hypothetical protein n=1 Tax=Halomonas sp. I5-271120 TaxID=3061632 RepID=UPI00350E3688
MSERPDGKSVCAILTKVARDIVTGIHHHRMPLALDIESPEPWLAPYQTDREIIR